MQCGKLGTRVGQVLGNIQEVQSPRCGGGVREVTEGFLEVLRITAKQGRPVFSRQGKSVSKRSKSRNNMGGRLKEVLVCLKKFEHKPFNVAAILMAHALWSDSCLTLQPVGRAS